MSSAIKQLNVSLDSVACLVLSDDRIKMLIGCTLIQGYQTNEGEKKTFLDQDTPFS